MYRRSMTKINNKYVAEDDLCQVLENNSTFIVNSQGKKGAGS